MGDHRGDDRGHMPHEIGIVFFDQVVDRRAAGGDHRPAVALGQQPVVLGGYVSRAIGGFPAAEEAQALDGGRQLLALLEPEGTGEGGGQGHDDPFPCLDERLHPLHVAKEGFGVRGAGG